MHLIILLLRDKNQDYRKCIFYDVFIGGVFCFTKLVTFSIGPVGTQHRIGPQTVHNACHTKEHKGVLFGVRLLKPWADFHPVFQDPSLLKDHYCRANASD